LDFNKNIHGEYSDEYKNFLKILNNILLKLEEFEKAKEVFIKLLDII
jgi:hypothetical protein